MTGPYDHELQARLRSADPASSLPPAAPERVARLLEETVSHDIDASAGATGRTGSRAAGARGRGPLTWVLAAAAVLVIVGGAVFIGTTGDDAPTSPPAADPGPTVTELTAPEGAPARCQVPNAQTIGNAEVAFDGTVESVEDGLVTLTPTTFYTGEETELVTVEAPAGGFGALLTSVEFRPGGRYLVAATPTGEVIVCGMSATWSEGLARLYAEAFGG